jgi:hypothetical protein
MKHITFLTVALVIIASSVFAADFNPTTMKLSASEVISYDFQSTLKIPVTVTGTPASLYFLVYTKDKGEQIVDVRNGFLGWHYLPVIPVQFSTGQQ